MTIKGADPCMDFSKAYLPSCNAFNGMEAELLYDGYNTNFYLNIQTLQFPCSDEDESVANVTIVIGDQIYSIQSEILKGGQRIRLPLEIQQLIIDSLLEGSEVLISVGRYRATLIPDNFALPIERCDETILNV